MACSTILRVKRRLEDNPQDALVLMCKRIKMDTEEIAPSLFVFRGTVDNKETVQVKDIFPKEDIKLKPKHNMNNIIEKIRKERKEMSAESRYKIVNYSRGFKGNNNEENGDQFDLVDLQLKTDKEKDEQYAYDLYIAPKQDFDISMLDQLVTIENYETELIYGSHRDNGRMSQSSSEADDDDDSNDENNWRNEYPDSEPSSIDEEDMIRAMQRCDIDDGDTEDEEIYNDSLNLFNEDVLRYGADYARYKAKVLETDPDLGNSLVHSVKIKDLDEESIDGYKNDSDDGFYYGQDDDNEQFEEQYREVSSDEYSPD